MTETLFISDLHLSGERPETVQRFLRFLQQRAPQADQLYILGDLFDAWIGDDLDLPPIPQIKQALQRLTGNGVPVSLMHGNRDFLIGERFCQETGAELLPDPTLIDLEGIPTLLMHGDLLCSDDLAYQAFRRQIREPAFIQAFLQQSIPDRLKTAAEYRTRSGEANSLKAEAIMDVNQQTVEDFMRDHDARRLIHGHTHRPDVHSFTLDGAEARRYVLADWDDDRAALLRISPEGWQSEPIL